MSHRVPGAPAASPTSAPTLDPALQAKARAFASQRRGLAFVEILVLSIFFILWVSTGFRDLIAAPWRAIGAPWWVILLVESTAFGVSGLILTLPFRYLGGYALPRHFGLLTQSLDGWAEDVVKSLAFLAALGLPSLLVFYALVRYAAERWWLWAWLLYTVAVILFAAVFPVVLLPIFYRLRPASPEHADLVGRLMALAERARVRTRGVSLLDLSSRTPAANAFLMGLGTTRRIVLSDTLVSSFTADEIETVLAHELAHHVHRDIPVGIAVHAVLSLGVFRLADLAIRAYTSSYHLKSMADPAALPIHLMILGLAFLASSPLTNAYSRWRESRADTFALRLTGKPEAFAGAMVRFANQNLAVAGSSWIGSRTGSHPSLLSRIRKAEAYSAGLRMGSDEPVPDGQPPATPPA
jgi:STE24 endopeptidase